MLMPSTQKSRSAIIADLPVKSNKTSEQSRSALTLLVLGIAADYANNAVTADNLALAADFLNRSTDFHFLLQN